MNKRYFIFGLLAATLAFHACSDEDKPYVANKFDYSTPDTGGGSEPQLTPPEPSPTPKTCPAGYTLTVSTQECVPIEVDPKTCPEGQVFNAETQECIPSGGEPKTCPAGYTLSADMQECIPGKVAPPICPEGQTLVAETGECAPLGAEGSGKWGSKCKNDLTCSDAGLKCQDDICIINMKTPALFAATEGGGVFTSFDSGQNWIARDLGMEKDADKNVKFLYFNNEILFVGTGGNGIYKFGEGSQKWSKVTDSGLTNKNVTSMCKFKEKTYVGTNGGGVFRLNAGVWEAKNTGLGNYLSVTSLMCSDSAIFAVTTGGAYISVQGDSWLTLSAASDTTNKKVISLAKFGSEIYAGTSGDGIFKFVSGKWVKEQKPDEMLTKTIASFGKTNLAMYAGSGTGEIFSLGAAGGVWGYSTTLAGIYDGPGNPATPPPLKVTSFVEYNGKIYIGTNGYGIFDLSNNQINIGLTNKFINAMVYVNVP